MEWTDTMMLDSGIDVSAEAAASARHFTRVVALSGATLLCADPKSRTETQAALELLRGFRATSRRVVVCDTTPLVVGKQFGREAVERGAASLMVSCGISGREVGIGARDAGLDLGSVVVCSKPQAAGQVLAKQIVTGDTVLLLGFDRQTCDRFAELLNASKPTAVAA